MAKFQVQQIIGDLVTLKAGVSNYETTFRCRTAAQLPAPGQTTIGTVQAVAWKAERVDLGGNYIEPLVGRPRRMQGQILQVHPETNSLTVQVGYPVTVKLPQERYQAANFPVGSRVGWDNKEIPEFIPDAV